MTRVLWIIAFASFPFCLIDDWQCAQAHPREEIANNDTCQDSLGEFNGLCETLFTIKKPYSCERESRVEECTSYPKKTQATCYRVGSRWVEYECMKTEYRLECDTVEALVPAKCTVITDIQTPYDCMETIEESDCKRERIHIDESCSRTVTRDESYECLEHHTEEVCTKKRIALLGNSTCTTSLPEPKQYSCEANEAITLPNCSASSKVMALLAKQEERGMAAEFCYKTRYVEEPYECVEETEEYRCDNEIAGLEEEVEQPGWESRRNWDTDSSEKISYDRSTVNPPPFSLLRQSFLTRPVLGGARNLRPGCELQRTSSPSTCTREVAVNEVVPCANSSEKVFDKHRYFNTASLHELCSLSAGCYKREFDLSGDTCWRLNHTTECRRENLTKNKMCSLPVRQEEEYTCASEETIELTKCKPIKTERASTCYENKEKVIEYDCLETRSIQDCRAIPFQNSGLCYKSITFQEPYICASTELAQSCKQVQKRGDSVCYEEMNEQHRYVCDEDEHLELCRAKLAENDLRQKQASQARPDSDEVINGLVEGLSTGLYDSKEKITGLSHTPGQETDEIQGTNIAAQGYPYSGLPRYTGAPSAKPQTAILPTNAATKSEAKDSSGIKWETIFADFIPGMMDSSYVEQRTPDINAFDGVWTVDLQRSQTVAPILSILGVSSSAQKVFNSFKTSVTINMEDRSRASSNPHFVMHSTTTLPLNRSKSVTADLNLAPFKHTDSNTGTCIVRALAHRGRIMQKSICDGIPGLTLYEDRVVIVDSFGRRLSKTHNFQYDFAEEEPLLGLYVLDYSEQDSEGTRLGNTPQRRKLGRRQHLRYTPTPKRSSTTGSSKTYMLLKWTAVIGGQVTASYRWFKQQSGILDD